MCILQASGSFDGVRLEGGIAISGFADLGEMAQCKVKLPLHGGLCFGRPRNFSAQCHGPKPLQTPSAAWFTRLRPFQIRLGV